MKTPASIVSLVAAAGCVALAQAPARDPRPAPPTGTSAIAGRVVTMDTPPVPVRRARVVVTSTNLEITRTEMTSDDGSFSVGNLPAGRYTVSASKAGMLRSSYGAVRPTRPGTAVSAAAGQKLGDLVIPLARGGVITGLLFDPHGRPARGVPLRVQEARTIGGRRTLSAVTITPGTSGETTDDRGEFRLFGLPPGEYVVSASPSDEGNGLTRAAGGGTVGYVPVYYPGTAVATDARTVTVKAGEETGGVNFQLQLVRTARVSGRVSAPPGVRPEDVVMSLMPRSASAVAGSYVAVLNAISLRAIAGVTPDWTFSYQGISPGLYTVMARVAERAPGGSAARSPGMIAIGAGTTQLWASADVVVDGIDQTALTLTLQPGVTLSGRVEFQPAATGVTPDLSRVRVSIQGMARADGGILLSAPVTTVNAAGEFSLKGVVPGQYRVHASVSGTGNVTWWVRSSIVDGRDTLDFPVDVQPNVDVNAIVVTLTTAMQRVSGVFQDASGRPATAFTIVLFPSDPELRAVSRRVRTARPGQDGQYVIDNVPPGDYRIAAVFDITSAEANDAALLESLVAASVLITIGPGERKVQNLKISR